MTQFERDRPKFEGMGGTDLIKLLDKIRDNLRYCEDGGACMLWLGEVLGVDMKAGAYDDE